MEVSHEVNDNSQEIDRPNYGFSVHNTVDGNTDIELDLEGLNNLKSKNKDNPFIGYLNINSLRFKIIELKEIILKSNFEILTVSETKLDDDFPDNMFKIDGYHPPFRRGRDCHGGGLMTFIRSDIPSARREELESPSIEMTCIQITLSRRKWAIISLYRPQRTSTNVFLSELTDSLDVIINRYDNILILGDLNIDLMDPNDQGFNNLVDFCEIFDLTNLINFDTCVTKNHSSSIDVILTNRKGCFKNSGTVETGASDFHKMVLTMFKGRFIKQKPIEITYRDYRYFNESVFLHDLRAAPFDLCESLAQRDTNLAYNFFVKTFLQVIDRHAPLKSETIRGNQAPFMTKELSKAIMTRSRLRNIYNHNKTAENWELFRRQRNLCVTLRRKSIRNYFAGISQRESVKSTTFWKTIRPFLNSKDGLNNEPISLFENGELVTKNDRIAEIFNEYYINILKETTGNEPSSLPSNVESENDLLDI